MDRGCRFDPEKSNIYNGLRAAARSGNDENILEEPKVIRGVLPVCAARGLVSRAWWLRRLRLCLGHFPLRASELLLDLTRRVKFLLVGNREAVRSMSEGGKSSRRVAISQSNYIPWRGYFDLIASVDEFVFYDDVQYTTGDWRNRNRIKTPQGTQWLTIPVKASRRRICDIPISDVRCGHKHWTILASNYTRARYFSEVEAWLKPLYFEPWASLSELNQHLIAEVCSVLGIRTKLSRSSDYGAVGDRSGRLLALCQEVGAGTYLSGPSAAAYLDVDVFRRGGVEVAWMDYGGLPEYPQLWGSFDARVSIVDLLFNCGPDAPRFLKVPRS